MASKILDADIAELTHSLGLLVRRVRAASASHELSWTEMSVLSRLSKDGPATTADLARAQGMRPQSMGTIVSALEDLRMIERTPHPTDGRQMNVTLTAKGAATQKTSKDAKRTWLAQAIAQLDKRERKTLFAAGELMKRLAQL